MNTSAADANRRLFNASSASSSSFMSGNNTLPSSIHRSSSGLSSNNKLASNTSSKSNNNSRNFVQEREAQERARRSYALYFLRLLGITIVCVMGIVVLWQYGVFTSNVKSMRGYAPTHVFTHHDRVRHSRPVAINDPHVDDSTSVIIDGVVVGVMPAPSDSDRSYSTFNGGDTSAMYGQENAGHHRPMTSGGSLSQLVYATIFGEDEQEEDTDLVGGDFINLKDSSEDGYTPPPTIPTPETPDPAGTGAIVGLFVLLVNLVNNVAPLLAVLGVLYAIYCLVELCTVRGSRKYFRSFCEKELAREALRLHRGGAGTVTGQQKDDFTKLIMDGSIDMSSNPSLWLSATVSAGKSLFKTEGPLVVPNFDTRSTTNAASSSVANHRRGAAAGAAANDVNTQEELNRYMRISEDTENQAALVANSSSNNDPSGSRFRFLRDGADSGASQSSFQQYGSQQEKAKKTQGVGVVYGSLQSSSQAFTDQNTNADGTSGASLQQSAATRRLIELLERVTRNGGISGDSIPRGLGVPTSAVLAFDREWESIKMNMLTWSPLNVKNPNQSVQNARRWVCSVFNKLWSDIEACNKSLVTDGAQLVIPMPQVTTAPTTTTTGATTGGFGGAKPAGFGGGGGFGGGATTGGGGFGGGAAATTAANNQPKELTLMGLSIYECSLALCSPDPGIAATLAAQKAASTTTTGTTTGGFGGAKPAGFGGGGGFGGGATTGGFGGGAAANKPPEASPNQCALTALLNEKSRLTSMGVASSPNLISRVEAIKRRISLEVTLDMAASILYAAAAACYRQAASSAPQAAAPATAAKPATGGFGGGAATGGFGGGGGFGKPATGGGFGGGATTGGFGAAAPAAAAAPQSPPHYMMPAERQRMRNYILSRIRKFAHDPTLRSFRNNGVDIPEWEESFPQDPHLILHVLSTRCEAFNPSIVTTDLEQGGSAPATTAAAAAPTAGGFGATAAAPAAPAAASKPHVQLNTGPIRLAHLPGLSTVAPPPPILPDSAAPQGLEASRRQIPPQHHPVLFVGSAAQPYFYVGVPQVPGAPTRGDVDLSLFMSSGGRPDDSSSSNLGSGFPMAGSAAWGNFGEDGSSFGMGTSSPAAAPTFFRTSHSSGDSLFEAMVVFASLRKMATPPPTEEQMKSTRSRAQPGSRAGAAESDGETGGAAYGQEDLEDAEAAHLTNEDIHTRTLNRIVE